MKVTQKVLQSQKSLRFFHENLDFNAGSSFGNNYLVVMVFQKRLQNVPLFLKNVLYKNFRQAIFSWNRGYSKQIARIRKPQFSAFVVNKFHQNIITKNVFSIWTF